MDEAKEQCATQKPILCSLCGNSYSIMDYSGDPVCCSGPDCEHPCCALCHFNFVLPARMEIMLVRTQAFCQSRYPAIFAQERKASENKLPRKNPVLKRSYGRVF